MNKINHAKVIDGIEKVPSYSYIAMAQILSGEGMDVREFLELSAEEADYLFSSYRKFLELKSFPGYSQDDISRMGTYPGYSRDT